MPTINFTKPTNTDAYAALLTSIRDNVSSAAFLLDPTYVTAYTGQVLGHKRLSANRFQEYNGTTWADIAINGLFSDGSNYGIGTTVTNANSRLMVDRLNGGSVIPTLIAGTVATFAGSSAAGSPSYVQLISGNASNASILFGDTDAALRGRIQYAHTDDTMSFTAGGVTGLWVNSAGDIGVGTLKNEYGFAVEALVGSYAPSQTPNGYVLRGQASIGTSTWLGGLMLESSAGGSPSVGLYGPNSITGGSATMQKMLEITGSGTVQYVSVKGGSDGTERFRVNNVPGVHVGDSVLDAASSAAGVYSRSRLVSVATTQFGIFENTMASASATSEHRGIYVAMRGEAGTYTTAAAYGLRIGNYTPGAGQTITTFGGIVVDDLNAGSTANRAVTLNVSTGTGKYNVYAAGSADNYMLGRLALGTPTVDNQVHTLDIYAGSGRTLCLSSSVTDAAAKVGRVATRHYTNAEEAFSVIGGNSFSTGNFVEVGGGSATLNAASGIIFYTAADAITLTGTIRGRIDNNGVFVIGTGTATTAAAAASQVTPTFQNLGVSIATSSGLNANYQAGSSYAAMMFAKSRGATVGAHAVTASGDTMGALHFSASDGTNFIEGARIVASVDGTPAANSMFGRLSFFTANASNVATERMRITAAGEIQQVSPAGIGYGTGSGGAVTQLTDKTTLVTLSKPTGKITMAATSLAAGATVQFTVTNTLVTLNDAIAITAAGSAGYRVEVAAVLSGSFIVRVTNVTAGALAEALVLNFAVLRVSNA